MNKVYHIELDVHEAEALIDIGSDNWPSCEEDWDLVMPDYKALEKDGLVWIDDDDIGLTNEGVFASHACEELQYKSPICLFFTQEEVDKFATLSEEEQSSYFPYVAGELVA